MHSAGEQQMPFAQVSQGLLWLPKAAEGHGVPQPGRVTPAGRFGKRMLLPQPAVTAPAARTSTERALQTPQQRYLEKTSLLQATEPRGLECCHGKGLRAERSDRTLPRASHSKGARREGRRDGWPEEPSKTRGRVRKRSAKCQGSGRR